MAKAFSKTVLVVDDSADNADSLAAVISTMGHRTLVAYDVATGLGLAHDVVPRIIFHDIVMPDVDGFAAVRELRKHEKFAATVMVAVTALAWPEIEEDALAAGFDVYLRKPARLRELEKVLNP
jgi:CheY-like chemotaxis protein